MKIYYACVLLLLGLLQPAIQQCLTPSDNHIPNKNGSMVLYNGQQAFSLALLQAINQFTPNENLFFSPYSTYHALLMAYFIASNQTENYLKKVLHLDNNQDKADIYAAYKLDKFSMLQKSNNASYDFTNANRIYVANQIQVRDCILSRFADEYFKTDFASNPEKARNDINRWVEEQTHNMIKDLLPFGTIDKDTNLVLVNAAYFKGIWENKFDPALTKQEVFYITPSKHTVVDMMHVEGSFYHGVSENLMAHILELPYQGEDVSMFILLPPFAKVDGIETVLKRLTVDKFKSILNNDLFPRTVQVSLPKFSLERTIELVPILEKLGVGDLFRAGADFSTLTENNDVSLGRGIHKAKIEVTEEGTKAAAATVLFTFRSSRPAEPAQFNCNHPFIYIIYDRTREAILFTGVFRRPY